jgi:UDP-N-acetylglucosamine diphosphorylase/glucosamine-1-phosphate N-acetyltransferase
MSAVHVTLFEDEHVANLAPLTLTRPAYELLCGGGSLLATLAECRPQGKPLAVDVRVREYLKPLADERLAAMVQAGVFAAVNGETRPRLVLNARFAPTPDLIEPLVSRTLAADRSLVWKDGDTLVAAILPSAVRYEPAALVAADSTDSAEPFTESLPSQLPPLLRYPFDIIARHGEALNNALRHRISRNNGLTQTQDGLFVAAGATVAEFVSVDTTAGPVVIDTDARVGPFTFLRGPVYVGPGSTVNEQAALKDGVYIGRRCKAGGEIECAVLSDFSNKQHFGFLGNAYVGSWVNLGAGTSNSDLKNTYGTVNVQIRGKKVNTGLQFVGCMIGDFAKTAIHTAIYTGKTIGAATGVYAAVCEDVPSFVNYPGNMAEATAVDPAVAVTTMTRMYARRGQTPSAAEQDLLHRVFQETQRDRPAEMLTAKPKI